MADLAVAERYRRRGLAKELTGRCLEALRREGIGKCHVFVFAANGDGDRFWRSVGWDRREDLAVMSRTINGL